MNRRILIPYLAVLASVPIFAEVDLSGNWAARQHQDWQERGPGPEPVDYSGLPINAEGRAKALKYQASILSLPERQCLYYTPAYLVIGPFPIKMWAETDPTTGKTLAWKVGGLIDRAILTIWMDGRPHPARVRAAHQLWIHHRRMGGRCAHHLHHAFQGRLYTSQRNSQ